MTTNDQSYTLFQITAIELVQKDGIDNAHNGPYRIHCVTLGEDSTQTILSLPGNWIRKWEPVVGGYVTKSATKVKYYPTKPAYPVVIKAKVVVVPSAASYLSMYTASFTHLNHIDRILRAETPLQLEDIVKLRTASKELRKAIKRTRDSLLTTERSVVPMKLLDTVVSEEVVTDHTEFDGDNVAEESA